LIKYEPGIPTCAKWFQIQSPPFRVKRRVGRTSLPKLEQIQRWTEAE